MSALDDKKGAAEPDDEDVVEEVSTGTATQMSEEDLEEERRFMLDPEQKLVCRFYENQYPDLEEVLVVNVTRIGDLGAYVTLLEYNNIEAMILLSELSRRRIRSVNKLIRVNRQEVVMVLRVDKEKGYIDLSKRRVSPEDVTKAEDRFSKAKNVHKILRQLAERQGKSLKSLYKEVGWPLYKKYGHAHNAFKMVLTDQEDVFEGLDPPVPKQLQAELTEEIKKRLAPQPIKIRADVEVTCFTYAGIDAVRSSLMAGQQHGTADSPVKVKLVAPPHYVVTTTTLDKDHGIDMLNKAIVTITEQILAQGGKIEVKLPPKAVSAREESDLAAKMEQLALEAEQVDGDGGDSDDDE